MNRFVKSIVISIVLSVFVFNLNAFADSKTVNLKVSKGDKIQIQIMYSVNSKTCVADDIPPKPVLVQKPKLGTLSYRPDTRKPSQCPKIMINLIVADYIAAGIAGVDNFKIHWKSKKGFIFYRNYIIRVE